MEKAMEKFEKGTMVGKAVEVGLALDLKIHTAILERLIQLDFVGDWEGKEALERLEKRFMAEIHAWNGLRTRIIYAGPGVGEAILDTKIEIHLDSKPQKAWVQEANDSFGV